MSLIKPFSEIGRNDALIAGGKGASLGEMTQAGIPVPGGFVLLSSAFERFLEETDLNVEIDSILHTVNKDEMRSIEHASETIQQLILNAPMPADIAADVQQHFDKLGTEYVAVRSSATAEDSASAAWAGQLDSFLNTTATTLLTNVQQCWASLFTPRAIFYRFENSLHTTKISVAVVVQKMVNSEISGIAFSVHPVTEDRNQLIIEAGYGLGEAIVSGQITPDSYVVEKEPRRIIDINVSTQTQALYRAFPGGNEWREIAEPIASSQVLTKEQILELSEMILKIENHYGFPCDIEWAYEAEKFYIVQSRPITTLAPMNIVTEKSPLNPNAEIIKWGPTPVYPLLRYYTCVTGLFIVFPKLYPGYSWPKVLILSDGSQFIWMHEHDEIRKNGAKLFMDLMLPKDTREAIRSKWKEALVELNELEHKIGDTVSSLSDTELSAMWTEFHRRTDNFWAHASLPELSNYGSIELLTEELKKTISESEVALVLETLCAPEEISFYQQEEIDLSETHDIAAHQHTYFWLKNSYANVEVLPIEFFAKRKKEIPAGLRDTVRTRLQKVREAKDEIQTKYHLPSIVREMGDAIADGIAWQDTRKKDIWIYLHYEDVMLQEIARRVGVDKNLLTYSAHEEIPLLMSGSMSVEDVRPRIEATGICSENGRVEVIRPEDAVMYWKKYVDIKAVMDVTEFTGIIASKGKVQGRVKIVLDPHRKVDFNDGEILVTTMTTPEFIFIMKKAVAVVTDTGGLTSHAAIVSRELNVPCLVGTKVATQVLHNGDLIEVDANNGVVRILARREKHQLSLFGFRDFCAASIQMSITSESRKSVWFGNEAVPGEYLVGERNLGTKFRAYMGAAQIDWFKKKMEALYTHDPDFVDRLLVDINAQYDTLESAIVSEKVFAIEELIPFLRSASDCWTMLAALCWLVEYLESVAVGVQEKLAIEKLLVFRKRSELFIPNLDMIIKQSLRASQFVPEKYIDFVTLEDIAGTAPTVQVLEERASYLFINKDGAYAGEEGRRVRSGYNLLEPDVSTTGDTFSGQSAFKGKVTGRVRIVQNREEAGRVQDGEVIVSSTTTPDFMIGIKKCVAMVTDEGGMICHAAIVSRELKIPCIVGTKIATQVLHDGDLVEVDADTGVVRIIQRQK